MNGASEFAKAVGLAGCARPNIDFDDVKAAMIARLDDLIDELIPVQSRGKTKGDELWCCNPTRMDKEPDSFSINTTTGQWYDFSGKQRGNILTLWCQVKGLTDNTEAMFSVAKFLNVPERGKIHNFNEARKQRETPNKKKPKQPLGPIIATYDYTDVDGTLLYQVTRHNPKNFLQRRPDGKGDWIWSIGDVKHVIYRWPEIAKYPDATVFVCEGEKDTDRVASLGHCATTVTASSNWAECNGIDALAGRHIIVLEDNDESGRNRALAAAVALHDKAASIRYVSLPGLPEKGDVSDWLDADPANADRLVDFCLSVPEWVNPTTKEEEPPPEATNTDTATPLILSSAGFLEGFIPPDYLIDGILQRRFCYSMTAPTGTGKTTIALTLTAHVALGRPIGEAVVEKGRVLYLAGENPDDIRMRWLASADKLGFDTNNIDVHFLPGVFKISEIGPRIYAEVTQIGPVALVVVDTSAAYYEGDDENANVQMGIHARRMRALVGLPGEPCVLVACHPVKNATPDNMVPKGGGSFLNEVDGNLTCSKLDSVVTLHWQGKYPGPDFPPIPFELHTVTTDRLRDSKGRLIPSVVATPLSEKERSEADVNSRKDEDAILMEIDHGEHRSLNELAANLEWLTRDGKPNKSRAQKVVDRLKKNRLVKVERGGHVLTTAGKDAVKRLKGE
jgi:hypothetical protein